MSSFLCIRLGVLLPLFAIMAAGQFAVTTFDVAGNSATFPAAINNNGDIAGTFTNTLGRTSGFIRMADGTVTTFDLSSIGGSLSTVTGINDLGQVAGTGTVGGLTAGFIRDAQGNISTFGSPDAGFVVESVVGLNNAGESIVTLFASDINGGATGLSTCRTKVESS